MQIKETEWKECECCGRRGEIISEAVYGCDNCGAIIDYNNQGDDYLRVVFFYSGSDKDADEFHLCSWVCVFEFLTHADFENDYQGVSFVDMPYLQFDEEVKTQVRVESFLALAKKALDAETVSPP